MTRHTTDPGAIHAAMWLYTGCHYQAVLTDAGDDSAAQALRTAMEAMLPHFRSRYGDCAMAAAVATVEATAGATAAYDPTGVEFDIAPTAPSYLHRLATGGLNRHERRSAKAKGRAGH